MTVLGAVARAEPAPGAPVPEVWALWPGEVALDAPVMDVFDWVPDVPSALGVGWPFGYWELLPPPPAVL